MGEAVEGPPKNHRRSELLHFAESSPRYEGWRMVLASFIGVMVSFAAVVPYTFSVSSGLGMLLDRVPPRRVILPCIVIFAIGLASLLAHPPSWSVLPRVLCPWHLWQWHGAASLLPRHPQLVSGTARLGACADAHRQRYRSIVVPIVTQALIAHSGWRAAYLGLGLIALLGLPLTASLLRNQPRRLSTEDSSADGASMRSALHGSIFWILAVIVALSAFGANGLMSHLAAILGERGIAGRLLTGLLLERFFAPYMSALMLLVSALSMGLLAGASSSHIALLGAALLGFGLGSEADVAPYLIARYFGRKHFSALCGLTWTAYAIGGAMGPLFIGRLYNRVSSYQPRLVLALAMTCLIEAALSFLLPRYPALAESASAGTSLTARVPLEN